MSKIEFEETIIGASIYRQTLQAKIKDVCTKIEFDDSGVTWIIFDPNKNYPNSVLNPVFVGKRGSDYGHCDPFQKKIWISTIALHQASTSSLSMMKATFQPKSMETDLLADIILDEITHIQTKSKPPAKPEA